MVRQAGTMGPMEMEVNKLQLPLEHQQQKCCMENLIVVPSKHTRANSSENVNGHPRDSAKEHRPANTVSMYVGIGKQKILPKTVTEFPVGSKRSESTVIQKQEVSTNGLPLQKQASVHGGKQQHKSLLRYRKIQGSNNDNSFSALNPLKEFKRQTLRGQVRAALTQADRNLRGYLQQVEKAESQFIGCCQLEREEEYARAAQVRLLNYSVDYNVPEQFLRALKFLADFHLHTDKIERAVFYYDQTREACLLLDHRVLLVESLIGLADCCGRVGAEAQGIRILKKALEYSWLRGLEEQELRIYDEIGKMHYYLGDLQKARQYHSRHINALNEPHNSALRQLSKQRIIKSEEINLETKYTQINRLLLVHLKAPIRSLEEVPLPYDESKNAQPIRKSYSLSNKYFGGNEAAAEIRHILKGWFFREEIQDPYLPETDWNAVKPKKYAFLDFQLNQQLKRLQGGGKAEKKKLSRSAFPVKESLEEQIARKIKEPPLRADWYESIVNQINRDHRNKLLNVRNAIRIRGFNKKVIPSLEILKDLYNSLFERSKQFVAQTGNFLS